MSDELVNLDTNISRSIITFWIQLQGYSMPTFFESSQTNKSLTTLTSSGCTTEVLLTVVLRSIT